MSRKVKHVHNSSSMMRQKSGMKCVVGLCEFVLAQGHIAAAISLIRTWKKKNVCLGKIICRKNWSPWYRWYLKMLSLGQKVKRFLGHARILEDGELSISRLILPEEKEHTFVKLYSVITLQKWKSWVEFWLRWIKLMSSCSTLKDQQQQY